MQSNIQQFDQSLADPNSTPEKIQEEFQGIKDQITKLIKNLNKTNPSSNTNDEQYKEFMSKKNSGNFLKAPDEEVIEDTEQRLIK